MLTCTCTPQTQAVTAALPVLAAAAPPGVRYGGYANGFRTTTSDWLAAKHRRQRQSSDAHSSASGSDTAAAAAAADVAGGGASSSDSQVVVREDDYDAEGVIFPQAYARHAAAWVAAGATIVGGCCGVGPEAIAAVRRAVGAGAEG